MHNQQHEQSGYQSSTQMQPEKNFGGHELFDSDEAIDTLIGAMEQYLLYESHIQDQGLASILQKQRTFLTQLYNTLIDTLKSGQDPAVPTQNYLMNESNDVLYGMQAKAPKTPCQSTNELNDECISSFMLGQTKAISSAFTTTALESTNPVLRRIFADSIPNIIEMGYELFLYQNQHQYYQVPQLSENHMQTIQNGFGPAQQNMQH